jgi:hypothetical protein
MGTKLSMKNPNPGIWFRFDENDPESGDVAIRPLNPAKREEIRKKAVKKRIEYKHGQRFEVEDVNDDLFSEMLWDYAITGWNDLLDDDGKPIDCTSENKFFLMRNHVGFARFIGSKMELLAEEYEGKITAENENLSKGSDGSGTQADRVVKNVKK